MSEEISCTQAAELLPAYALYALEESEHCGLAAHLAECRNHDEELAGFRGVTVSLASQLEPSAPPSRLREGLLGAFDREVAGGNADAAARRPLPAQPRRLFAMPAFAYGLAAAMLVLAIGLGAWGASRGGGDDDAFVRTAQATGGGSIKVTFLPDENVAVMDADLPALTGNRVYQAWRITGSGPVSIGTLGTSGLMSFEVDEESTAAIAISVEPAGGSPAPTTTPIAIAEI